MKTMIVMTAVCMEGANDKEKAIEEIKGIMDDESIRFVDQAIRYAIEIVKKGGIE